MNTTSITLRCSAAVASMVIAVSLFSGVTRLADKPVATSLLAQAASATIVR